MKKTKKALASLAIAGMVLSMAPVSVFAADNTDRIYGTDRYQTSIKIAEKAYTSATTAVIAAGNPNNLVDALAAAPLAAQEKAPILLTDKADMNDDVKASLTKLGVKKVFVVGAAASKAVLDELKAAGFEVEAIQGAGRVETAQKINEKLTSPAGTFVVGYNGVADAMSVASYAAANNYAIVVANADGSVAASTDASYIIGGPTLVKSVGDAQRIYGADRYETNKEVIEALTYEFGTVYVANGATLADALVASVLAGQTKSPIALSDGKNVEAAEVINPNMTADGKVVALGGTGVVSNSALDKVGYGVGDPEEVEFGVKDVSAANLIQVTVELTNDDYLDEDELKEESNYEFEGDEAGDGKRSATDIEIKKVDVDGATVTLTLENAVENQSKGNLVIDKSVTGEELKFTDIAFSDTDIPTIEEVKVIGKNMVKVTFSEPMAMELAYPNDEDQDKSKEVISDLEDEFEFELDGKSYGVDKIYSVNNGFEANVKVYGTFKEGSLKVEVGNGLEDHAGFNVIADTYEVDVVEDKEAPEVVSYKDATNSEVTLVFNEDIQFTGSTPDEDDFYHTNKNNEASEMEIDGKELTLTFSDDNKLPDGTAYVYVAADAVSDFWDNENDTIKVKVDINVDEIKPEVKKVEYKDDATIEVTFSEKVDEDSAEDTDNYVLVDEDDDKVSIRSADLDSKGKKVTLTLRDTDPDEGTYELTVQDVEDLAGNKVAKATYDVAIGDTGAPKFPDDVYYEEKNGDLKLYLEFSEEMAVDGNYSVADLEKYELYDGSKWVNLGKANADDDLDVDIRVTDGNKTVVITIDDLKHDSKLKLRIARVADAEGNLTVDLSSKDLSLSDKSTRTIAISTTADDVVATSRTTIEVKFDGNLDSYEVDDFIVWEDNGSEAGVVDGDEKVYTIDSIDVKGAKKIVIEIDEDGKNGKLAANPEAKKIMVGTVEDQDDIKTENSYGAKLKNKQAVAVKDEIKPEVAKKNDQDPTKSVNDSVNVNKTGKKDGIQQVYATYDSTAKTTEVTVEFTEDIDGITKSMIKVNGGDNIVKSSNMNGVKLEFVVDGELLKGDTIDISIVHDKADAPNYVTDLKLQIEYKVD